jgi:protein-disulfide isomerase
VIRKLLAVPALFAVLVLIACQKGGSAEQVGVAAANAAAPGNEAPPGVDLGKLDEGEKKIFFRAAGKVGSACGKPHSLLQSAKTDPSCKRSIFALRYAAKLANDGYLESEITELLEKRYAKQPAQIDVADVPMKGDPKSPVTIVEFVDFECPHCKHLQPVLDRLVDEYKGQVRVYFKNFPLKNHTYAEGAAFASVAAQRQGKFWAMTAKMWQHQDALAPPDLERYAKEAGLDLKKFKEDMAAAATRERVAKDRADGERLNLSGTPAVFINGRECTEPTKEYEVLKSWVEEEIATRK